MPAASDTTRSAVLLAGALRAVAGCAGSATCRTRTRRHEGRRPRPPAEEGLTPSVCTGGEVNDGRGDLGTLDLADIPTVPVGLGDMRDPVTRR